MGTDYYGYTNSITRALANILGDYLEGHCDWIEEELDYYSEQGYSKKQAKENLAYEIEEYVKQAYVNFKERSDPWERVFLEGPNDWDEQPDYLQIAEGWVYDYEPAKKTASNNRKSRTSSGKKSAAKRKPTQRRR